EDVNDTMRAQDVTEAERSIAYLKEQVAATALTDLQAMFFELIQSQTETIMLAQVRTEYLFKTIDPAVVPEEKDEPKRALICVLGFLLGGMLGVLWVLVRHYGLRREEP
ncbi:MAG: LPS O-antigen length regulator, partial [Pseudomonadales bacterium]|nr:LPS O-antigen length regulator [Pseudomonadales bacterium]